MVRLLSEPLGSIKGWDNVKLREVWQEFRWHCAREGITEVAQLSDYNLCVYHQLRMERARRGEQLGLF